MPNCCNPELQRRVKPGGEAKVEEVDCRKVPFAEDWEQDGHAGSAQKDVSVQLMICQARPAVCGCGQEVAGHAGGSAGPARVRPRVRLCVRAHSTGHPPVPPRPGVPGPRTCRARPAWRSSRRAPLGPRPPPVASRRSAEPAAARPRRRPRTCAGEGARCRPGGASPRSPSPPPPPQREREQPPPGSAGAARRRAAPPGRRRRRWPPRCPNRRKKKGDSILENPSIPNPFPELCCSPFTSVLSASLLPKATSRKKQVIKVYSEDDTSRALEVPSDITARDVCQLLILKNHYVDDHSWTLFEQLTHTGLGRAIEDHELVMEVQSNWVMEEETKLYFRKNYAKYEFFKNPLSFFPDHMISFPSETSAALSHSGILQMFLSSSTYPEIHGYLHAKEQGKKSWKKLYFLLRRSGLYFSTKGTSKEPRHLQFFCEFSNSDMYMSLTGKKISGAPTNYGFCFKPNKSGGTRDLKQLCADDEQSRTCWMTAIRLLKYGMQLYQNYMQPYQGRSGCSPLNITPMRSISENSLVAMDFSGHRSRIIENPTEALSVAVEEGLAWRRRGCLRLNSHGSPIAMSNMAIHRSQSWFHHKISREEAQRLILQHGLVDGVFLVRDSQSNPKTFVLSLSHGLKIKHFQIVPLEDDGKLFYTLDDGHTRFTDLIQLVEFYQLNKGVLPCKLKHYCARIAL
ncbi:growth factor receptor-bound protein 14 [Malurus melanocephalus]|uniref:growth factor receptor-bound protein 14 n=1 Tax=Malurus melanocephalus TaxID=175006 RepID=UPI002549AAF6|nr:growth factor receptor-bound protein 14 [Malurus melanocephalus]